MDRREFTLGASALAIATLTPAARAAQSDGISSAARSLWRRATVVDCNIGPQISADTFPMGQADLDVARASGLTAMKNSIGGFNASFEDTVGELSFYQRMIEAHPDVFMQIRNVADFATAKHTNKVGIIFGFESATALGDKLDNITMFRYLGVRVMQLSYNLTSPFGAGVLAPADATLTDLGRQAVARMNEVGVALDLSHANPATTAAAMAASTKPVIMSHAGCMSVHQNPRNKTDEQMRALANKGGVMGIFDLFYLAPAGVQPTLDIYMQHMTHALDVMGEDHVGFGSDTTFGATANTEQDRAEWNAETARRVAAGVAAPEEDGRLPYVEGLNRPDRSLVIADALMKRGYPARVAEKVLGANFVRVFGEIW
ncbi:MAG TPA: membrane dipeptidase [Vitreimonas sp.]|jgi:membrane dipeptidase|nr:membrane dipeptidase [Vitreimonas sp.]